MSSTTAAGASGGLALPGDGPRVRLLTPIVEDQKPKSPTFYEHQPIVIGPSSGELFRAHMMMLLSQALFAGNYVCFKSFSKASEDVFGKTSATIFSMMRGTRDRMKTSGPPYYTLYVGYSVLLRDLFDPDRHYEGVLRLKKTNVKPVLIQGLAGAARQNIVPYGLMFTGAASAGVVQPFVPVCTCMLAVAFGLEKGNKIKYLSMLIGCVGVFIAAKGYDFAGVDLGFLILLGVPVTKAIQVTGQKVALSTMRPMAVQFYQIICLCAFTTPFTLSILGWDMPRAWHLISVLGVHGWGAVLYSVFFIILISWRIQLAAVKQLGPIAVGLYQVTQPVFCFIFAYFLLGEPIFPHQVLGGILVCIGLGIFVYGQYLAALKKEREAEQARARETERVPDRSPQPTAEGDDAMEAGRAQDNVRPRRKHSRSVGLHFASSVSDM
ncbi:hypothetical protein FOL47_007859 [Perkinsus chesapeaki]|uniref:EamA domain-containing protein n=1 Tax=Perkinsus chesapeaki TaxID=330153 RepID=A0A7J6LHJ4_PERCH|nr:hypothetical protein FOL47_007859 [Perkinsus chesapeaki]